MWGVGCHVDWAAARRFGGLAIAPADSVVLPSVRYRSHPNIDANGKGQPIVSGHIDDSDLDAVEVFRFVEHPDLQSFECFGIVKHTDLQSGVGATGCVDHPFLDEAIEVFVAVHKGNLAHSIKAAIMVGGNSKMKKASVIAILADTKYGPPIGSFFALKLKPPLQAV